MGEILRAENISKTYQAGRVVVKALNRCSFTVERGEFVAVVGRSGSGKSTLLRILASFDKPDEGKVYVEGEDISGLKGKKLAQFRQEKIGFIYQDYSLFPEYTAYENVLLPLKIAHQAWIRSSWSGSLKNWELRTAGSGIPMKCPADKNSVWQLQGRWLQDRRCFLPMNRPEI